jgi:hypothetical protein
MTDDNTTPWSTAFLEKLTVTHQAKKFLISYRIVRFITVFTKPASRLHVKPVHTISKIYFNIIFSSTPRSSKLFIPFSFPT